MWDSLTIERKQRITLGGMLVGAAMEGKRVLVGDDVITAGTAIRESHNTHPNKCDAGWSCQCVRPEIAG